KRLVGGKRLYTLRSANSKPGFALMRDGKPNMFTGKPAGAARKCLTDHRLGRLGFLTSAVPHCSPVYNGGGLRSPLDGGQNARQIGNGFRVPARDATRSTQRRRRPVGAQSTGPRLARRTRALQ